MERCQLGLDFYRARVRPADVSSPFAPVSSEGLSKKKKMPEPNPQKSPVLCSVGRERTQIRIGKKKVVASISLNDFSSTRNGN